MNLSSPSISNMHFIKIYINILIINIQELVENNLIVNRAIQKKMDNCIKKKNGDASTFGHLWSM